MLNFVKYAYRHFTSDYYYCVQETRIKYIYSFLVKNALVLLNNSTKISIKGKKILYDLYVLIFPVRIIVFIIATIFSTKITFFFLLRQFFSSRFFKKTVFIFVTVQLSKGLLILSKKAFRYCFSFSVSSAFSSISGLLRKVSSTDFSLRHFSIFA